MFGSSLNVDISEAPVRDSDDTALAARIRAGDAAAFEAVFRRHVIPLCAFAFRYVRSRDLAAELVQEVFLWLWQHRERWEIHGSLAVYLRHATRNRALD